ncbi:MAG TPA: DNA internalization-related competence protein ComEC/Rec2 [Verrucomicrobiae bacterium]|nr:DNA internalization-related competence protein ComEC/Rec2 [Verrucomicrobiae bacterium]
MKRPLTGLVVTFASGIWMGSLTNWPVTMLFCLVACLLAAFLLLYRTRFGVVALFATVFAAGILGIRRTSTISSPIDITRLLGPRDQNAILRGVIVTDTGYREEAANDGGAERLRFELELSALQQDGQWRPTSGRIFVFATGSQSTPVEPLRYGDCVTLAAVLRVPLPVANPGAFDWRAWLAHRGMHFAATILQKDGVSVDAHGRGNSVLAVSLGLREYLERALRLGLEDEPKLAGVLAGMVIGERSEIPPDTYAGFQRTGVFHVFAISGLHVGLVTAVVLVVLRLLRIPRRWCGLAAIPLLIVYVFATGARPGAVRALVMACAWLVAWMLVRPADSLNTLAAAALVILVVDPSQLFDGGFVLSFAAVLSLLTLSPRIEVRLRTVIAPDPFLPRSFVPRWRQAVEPAAIWWVRLVSASLAVWAGLLPLMATYFHVFTPISVVANLLVVPLLGFIIALGMLSLLAFPVWPWLTLTLNNANFFLLSAMIRGVEWLSGVPVGHWFVQAPPLWATCGYYGLGMLLLSRRLGAPRHHLAVAMAAPIVGVALFLNSSRADKVDLTVLALNDGMSMFLDGAGEYGDVLIDGGSDWSGARVIVPFLRAQGVDRLAAMVLTRGDKAHAAGLAVVAHEVPTRVAIYNGLHSHSKYYGQWLGAMKARGVSLRVVKAGNELQFGRGVHVRVLNPPPGPASNRSDDNAVVLAIEFGPTRVLYMSDVGETVEKRLVKDFPDLRAQVIVKGQHGRETSCTGEFLDAVRPEAVVQVVGLRPSNRYPEPALRDRVAQRGIALYRTDDTGAVTMRLTREGYAINTYLK